VYVTHECGTRLEPRGNLTQNHHNHHLRAVVTHLSKCEGVVPEEQELETTHKAMPFKTRDAYNAWKRKRNTRYLQAYRQRQWQQKQRETPQKCEVVVKTARLRSHAAVCCEVDRLTVSVEACAAALADRSMLRNEPESVELENELRFAAPAPL